MDATYDALRALTSSKLRWGILDSLDAPMRLSELRREVGANAPNTSTKAKDLQRLGLIERDNGDYKITHIGRVIHEQLSLLVDTMDALYKHEEFWFKVIEFLPEELVRSIHWFKGARMIRNNKNNIEAVKQELLCYIKKAEDGLLVVVLPVKCEEISEAVKEAGKTVDTRLITLKDNPGLRYGLISSKRFVILFTEMLDMALVKKWSGRSELTCSWLDDEGMTLAPLRTLTGQVLVNGPVA